jgi:hypothetical protein
LAWTRELNLSAIQAFRKALRAIHRLSRAHSVVIWAVFFINPRYRVVVLPNCCLRMRNGCSTLARMPAFRRSGLQSDRISRPDDRSGSVADACLVASRHASEPGSPGSASRYLIAGVSALMQLADPQGALGYFRIATFVQSP